MLPEGWKKVSLTDAVRQKISYGIVQAGPHVDGGIPYIKSSDVRDDISLASLQRTSAEIHGKYIRSSVHPGDIVFSLRGNIGATCIVPSEISEANLTQGTARISCSQKVYPNFLIQELRSSSCIQQALNLSKGSTFKEISLESLRTLKIILPPFPEQKKIAAILSTWDRAIEGTEQLLANSQQQKKALMQQLLTGKKRLPGFTGEWESITLRELEKKGFLELGRGNVISKKDIDAHPGQNPIYSSSVKNCGLMGTYGHYMFDEELISWSVDGGGHFFHRKKHKFSITNVSGYMRVNQKNLNYKFLCSQLQFLHEKLHFDYQTKAHPSVIRDLYILNIPPLPEQKAIAAVLTTADEEIAAIESDLLRLRQEKKALMQQLLTGKRRVKVD
ncbi:MULTISPECIES: restriction endonuclease subunit S [Acetobacter]|jgi:type I restriction enzyme S subunit|uniref:restriction endonuclease subunit S n=1 Tax=Acetobacter TaxID=434 RepID=UPI0020A0F603|nr:MULTISPECIES: restriction endonuclease subunit S [Acetobacter]MCH4025619.1 restriction endonuclease subunit S [Acetobacter fabarum]MCH4054729.1 restriction endonuclease subunit S [Acetobacter fabarum]MCH4086522.1 restriction endonuclease subunit S [Acetobacter fabarum]MCH4138397.1 restriction endonuclease subunit S [Acetobacter fabarum]MCI1297503.1 restriction endonuclease subunit S [Acetobacter fabarum]